jgi:HlyD family secretion protein
VAGIAAALAVAGVAFVAARGSAVPVRTLVVAPAGAPASGAAVLAGVTANGYVVARTRASVSAKVPGRLAMLGVSEGSEVRAGEVIASLENADFAAAVAQAEANVLSARAQLAEAQTLRDQLEREARRLTTIRAEHPDLYAAQEVEAAESRALQAAARVRSAEAAVGAAEAGLRFARANLDNTYIRAPFTGTVLRKEAEVGEVVAPSVGGGLTRGAVVTMADLATLEVEVDVNEAYIGRIRHGQTAAITLDAYPEASFAGSVRQVVPTADRQRATVQVKVGILDRDPRILPEMGARVDFSGEPLPLTGGGGSAAPAGPAAVRVPASAVREHGGATVVWLVREGLLEARPVQAGPVSAGFREIRSGLAGGERVVVDGIASPRAGMRVKVEP